MFLQNFCNQTSFQVGLKCVIVVFPDRILTYFLKLLTVIFKRSYVRVSFVDQSR